MRQRAAWPIVPLLLLTTVGPAARAKKPFSEAARTAAIRHAKVWTPTPVAMMDLRAGPPGRDAFPPEALVTCQYVDGTLGGHTRKFSCDLGDNDVVKVRYGDDNGEVEGAVLASRLLWALGFWADRVYPVRVRCEGCSADPWNDRARARGVRLFDPATIDLKPAGRTIETDKHVGWAWSELNLVDETLGGATKAQRDALTLLAVFMQHGDSKPEQQRLMCLPGGVEDDGECAAPVMLLYDVGNTFGKANAFNKNSAGSVNFQNWAATPVWRSASACVGHLSKSNTGSLGDPLISEEGREFLAGLLVQLTDRQIYDLFSVARVERRGSHGASAEQWAQIFKQKRAEIVNARCPR